MSAIINRYEFVYLFDVTNGNPNGDPDAGNMPRLDPETSQGLVTDVCLKRKIRNFVLLSENNKAGYHIYMQEKSVLNNQHKKAYEALDIKPVPKKLPRENEQAQALTDWMCRTFFDVRAFGAVMTTEVNTGQVRGPVQLAFGSSIDPILPLEVAITRMAVTNERDLEKERTMGRKHIIPYGLYRVHGYISAKLAERTGFSDTDLKLLWQSLINMFEHDRSAARGEMSARRLIVFRHDGDLGNAPAHRLFEAVKVERIIGEKDTPARAFTD
ncbi:MAG: type I-C CRISPR-associated protein Cas7/Csd2, partial [Gammaproteobacteria bacterium]|nr:type I-C CRISPR-associated protein Cas7/Csd2 [Gammaproteobacteria bacterium]